MGSGTASPDAVPGVYSSGQERVPTAAVSAAEAGLPTDSPSLARVPAGSQAGESPAAGSSEEEPSSPDRAETDENVGSDGFQTRLDGWDGRVKKSRGI
jgi:hypothetical protein